MTKFFYEEYFGGELIDTKNHSTRLLINKWQYQLIQELPQYLIQPRKDINYRKNVPLLQYKFIFLIKMVNFHLLEVYNKLGVISLLYRKKCLTLNLVLINFIP